ncbi:MAG: integrase core domain-containing protein [Bacteroidales bacterium]
MFRSIMLFLNSSFKTKSQLQLENIFLRKQVEIKKRSSNKPSIKKSDRIFFSLIKNLLSNWKNNLIIVKPETVIKWHRKGFKLYWTIKSRKKNGRPKIDEEIRILIRQMALENPLWGAPRIHGEILKLGYRISQSTILRYIPKSNNRTTGQRWKTFLKNHSREIISIDFFTIATINFKIVYVLIFLDHHRRKIIYFNVTSNPTSLWTSLQMRNAFLDREIPKYLIRDRDSIFGNYFNDTIDSFGIKQLVTSYRSPWQNGYVERVIGSIRRECLDHLIIINENHLRNILSKYVSYYNNYLISA